MTFYEIRLTAQPKIRFACCVTAEQPGRNIIDHRQDLMELSIADNTDIYIETEYERYVRPKRTLAVFMPDCRYTMYTAEPILNSSSSIAVEIPDMRFARHSLEDAREIEALMEAADITTFFLPQVLESGDDFLFISALFKNFINHYIRNTTADYFRCLSIWYELVAYIESNFRSQIRLSNKGSRTSSAYYYVYKAKKYIAQHYCEPLALRDIAGALKLTPNYLCGIFRKETGRTIVDYVNMLRVQRVRELVDTKPYSLEELAAAVGLRDTRYLQRLFKKYYGVSMQRLRQIDHEISLYHPNPWEVDGLDRDIYPGQEAESPGGEG